MPSTHLSLHYHSIFSAKDRVAHMSEDWRGRLHAYIGAFTVSASPIDAVKNYIANQKEHHRKKSFQEEYLEFLIQCGVEYDEKYFW